MILGDDSGTRTGFTITGDDILQKYGFILSMQCKDELKRIADVDPQLKFYDDWVPNMFSPYSQRLKDDIEEYIENGMITKTQEDMFNSTYYITSGGRRARININHMFCDDMTAIDKEIRKLNNTDFVKLLQGINDMYPEYSKPVNVLATLDYYK